MKKSIKGRLTIKKILQHSLMNEDHISFEFIDKQFCIYAQIVDMTIEPVFYFIYKEDLYKNGGILFWRIVYIFSAVIILIKRQLVIFYILLKK